MASRVHKFTHLTGGDFTRTLCGEPINEAKRRGVSTVLTPTSEHVELLRASLSCDACAAILRDDQVDARKRYN